MDVIFEDDEQSKQPEKAAEVQPVKPVTPPKKLDPAAQIVKDVGNEFMVSGNMTRGITLASPRGFLSYERALVLAAWIVAMAEPFSSVKFEDVLKNVQNT